MSSNTITQFLTWTAGDYIFATDVRKCREVSQNVKLTEIPHAPDYLAGIVNLRGDVVTVLNINILLGETDVPQKNISVIIRIKSQKEHISLQADSVLDVIDAEAEHFQELPAHFREREINYLSGALKVDGRMVLIIDTEVLLNRNRKRT